METQAGILLSDISSNYQAFQELHTKPDYISSSEIATICGLNKYKTALELWAEKTGKLTKTYEENDNMWLGKKMEPIIAELFQKRTGLQCQPANAVFQSQEYPFAVASPDFFVVKDGNIGILECKNTGSWAKTEWGAEQAPDYAHCQLIWQLGVLGYDFGWIAGLLGGSPRDFHTPEFKFDETLFKAMIGRAEKFIECVKTNKPPEIVGDDLEVINAIAGAPQADVVAVLPEEAMSLFVKYDDLRTLRLEEEAKVEHLKDQEQAIKAELRLKCGNASEGAIGDRRVYVKQSLRKGYTVEAKVVTTVNIK